jgi:hypothetical protein
MIKIMIKRSEVRGQRSEVRPDWGSTGSRPARGVLKYGVRELAPAFGCVTPPQSEQAPLGKAAASRRTPYFRAALSPCRQGHLRLYIGRGSE